MTWRSSHTCRGRDRYPWVVSLQQQYRMRNPRTGREVIVEAEPGVVYRDRVSGERLEPVAKLVPLAPATSRLPFAVENLRFCPWCGQMAQYDHNDCPTCGRRMDPPPASEHSATAQH